MNARPINQAQVRQAVEALGCDWIYREQTGSTNADALQHRARYERDVVVFSEAQSAGRGRRGRDWLSPFARNIYCTVGISRGIDASRQGLLSIVTGVALCRALRRETGLEIALKWPNDLLLDGRKLGGILIESTALGAERFFFAVGFGLNLCMSDAELAALERPAISLQQRLGDGVNRNALLQSTIEAAVTALRAFEVESAEALAAEFAWLDAYHGAEVEVLSAGRSRRGISRGIDEYGQLRLQTDSGIEVHAAAEISLRVVGA